MSFYNKKVAITSGVVSIALVLAWRNLFSLIVYLLLTLSCSVIGPLVIILIHIALSPKHQTGISTLKTTVELDAFRTMLMVILKLNIIIKIFFILINCKTYDRYFRKDMNQNQQPVKQSTR